jgi:PAS domain S-box-containing protein
VYHTRPAAADRAPPDVPGRAAPLDVSAADPIARCARAAARALDAPVALVSLVRPDTHEEVLECVVEQDGGAAECGRTALARALCRRAVAAGSALAVDDARTHPGPHARGHAAAAAAPLVAADGTVLGALSVADAAPRVWTPRELALLGDLAAVAGAAAERSAAAATAAREQDRLTRLLAESPAVLYTCRIVAGALRATWVSDNVERLTGYTPAEALAPGWWAARVHPDDRGAAYAAWDEPCAARRRVHEYRFEHRDGGFRWIRDESLATAGPGGDVEIVGAWADVTTQRSVEHELRTSEARGAANVAAALDCIVTVDHEGRIIEFNAAAERTFGHARADVLGADMADLIIPEWARGMHRRGMQRYIETGEARMLNRRVEITALHASGREIPVELAVTHIAVDGPPTFTAFMRDITEQKRAAAALARSEGQLAYAQRVARMGSWELDVATGAVLVSEELYRLHGTGSDEAATTPDSLAARLHRADRRRLLDAFDEARRTETAMVVEYQLPAPDGTARHFEARAEPVRGHDGAVVRWVGTAQDVTDTRRLEAQYRHAQKMEAVGRLAAGVAHDFNNLLSAIQGYAEFVAAELEPGSQLHSDVGEIQSASRRAAGLTRQLLAYSRQQVLQPRLVDVPLLVGEMQEMLRRLVGEDVQLAALPGSHAGQVTADRGQLEQVLMNLVINARDAMPNGGTITVETDDVELDAASPVCWPGVAVPGSYVMLSVADTGDGIEAAMIGRIFEPFFTTKEQGKGTGLGLATVYGIVKQSGGYLWVESEPGRGSTFRVYLPRATGRAGLRTPSISVPAVRGDDSRSVLLVEDEEAVRAMAGRALRHAGFAVLEARHGRDALAVCARADVTVDLVITDVVMPEMGGRELARRLARLRPGVPLLFVSGYPDGHLLDGGALPDGVPLLDKPFTPQALVARVREVLAGTAAVGAG